jgi:outer membrane protein assembly factor BamB
MAPADGKVVALHTNDNSLTAFDLKSGKQAWQTTLKETSYKRFQRLGDRACTEGRDETDNIDEVQCYDLATGELKEKVQLGEWSDEKAWWPDLYAAEPTFYRFKGQTFQTMDLAQLRLADGSEVWSRNLGKDFAGPSIEDVPLVQDGKRVAFGSEGFIGIIAEGGAPVIVGEEEVKRYPLGFDGDLLYVAAIKQRGTQTVSLQGLDAATGEVRWKTDALADADSRFGEEEPTWKVVPGVGLIFGWDDGDSDIMHMTLFDAKGAEVWDHEEQLFISEAPAVFGSSGLVYGSASSTLVALDPKSGKLLWKIGD